MKALCVIGTRPEAIKMAPVVEALRARHGVQVVVCATAQHRGLLDQVLDLYGLKPDHDLDLMRQDQRLGDITASALTAVGKVIEEERPDAVVVQGDTTSTLAGALAAYYHRVPVAHVEAGLRTGDKYQPFPEEANRRLTDQLSDWLFPPTRAASDNLLREGFPPQRLLVTGNTGIDALAQIRRRLERGEHRERVTSFAREHGLDGRRLVLVTGHRRENHGQPLADVCRALAQLAADEDVAVLYPAHPNPNVQRAVAEHLGGSHVAVTGPLDYALFAWLLGRAEMVLTDSGGIQEEAAFLGVPTLVLRNTTERPEAVEAGVARLVGTDTDRILTEARRILGEPGARAAMARPTTAFGDGRASERIADRLLGGPGYPGLQRPWAESEFIERPGTRQ